MRILLVHCSYSFCFGIKKDEIEIRTSPLKMGTWHVSRWLDNISDTPESLMSADKWLDVNKIYYWCLLPLLLLLLSDSTRGPLLRARLASHWEHTYHKPQASQKHLHARTRSLSIPIVGIITGGCCSHPPNCTSASNLTAETGSKWGRSPYLKGTGTWVHGALRPLNSLWGDWYWDYQSITCKWTDYYKLFSQKPFLFSEAIWLEELLEGTWALTPRKVTGSTQSN